MQGQRLATPQPGGRDKDHDVAVAQAVGAQQELVYVDRAGMPGLPAGDARTLYNGSRTLGRIGGKLVITEPKTDRSRRTIPIAPSLVAMLRAHRADQEAERLAAANQWQDHGLVFATEFGTPVDPRNILRTIQIAAQKASMSDIGVHTLRHSAAVAWLESGVHIKAVADLLGHSSITITGDIYGHTSDDTARTAVEGLAGQLGLLG